MHVVAVDHPHSPIKITEFLFGQGDNLMRGPKIVVANQSKKDVTGYGLQVTYLASKGCNVRGTSDAPYDFIEIERTDVSSDPGIYRGISPGQSAEHRFNVRPDEPFSLSVR